MFNFEDDLLKTVYDFRTDAAGKDPDQHSLKLKRAHKFLWSKTLPIGDVLELRDEGVTGYLTYEREGRKFKLTSDSIGNSYANRKGSIKKIVNQIDPQIIEDFRSVNSTIGGYILFPGYRVDGKVTINGARGINQHIGDRFDLTLECIRRHYGGIKSPLADVLNRYREFFDLFVSFSGYVDFFFLNGLVDSASGQVKRFIGSDSQFTESPFPNSKAEYLEYYEASVEFIMGRTQNINQWAKREVRGDRFTWTAEGDIRVLE